MILRLVAQRLASAAHELGRPSFVLFFCLVFAYSFVLLALGFLTLFLFFSLDHVAVNVLSLPSSLLPSGSRLLLQRCLLSRERVSVCPSVDSVVCEKPGWVRAAMPSSVPLKTEAVVRALNRFIFSFLCLNSWKHVDFESVSF